MSQKTLFLRLSLAGPFLGPFPISTDPNTKIVRHGHHSHPVLECMHLVIVYILHIVQYAGKFVKSEEEWQSHAPYFRTCETDDVEEVHLDFWMPPYFSNTVDVFLKHFWCVSQILLMYFSNTFEQELDFCESLDSNLISHLLHFTVTKNSLQLHFSRISIGL